VDLAASDREAPVSEELKGHRRMLSDIIQYALVHRAQLAKFTVVGFLVFGVYVGCFHFFYRVMGLDYKLAVSLAYVIGVACHFLLHRFFTFGAAEQDLVHHTWKYLLMLGLNYAVSLGVVWIVVEVVKISPYFGLVASTGITAGISFFMMKHFVFDEGSAA
jgi:putative flippase GtrA